MRQQQGQGKRGTTAGYSRGGGGGGSMLTHDMHPRTVCIRHGLRGTQIRFMTCASGAHMGSQVLGYAEGASAFGH